MRSACPAATHTTGRPGRRAFRQASGVFTRARARAHGAGAGRAGDGRRIMRAWLDGSSLTGGGRTGLTKPQGTAIDETELCIPVLCNTEGDEDWWRRTGFWRLVNSQAKPRGIRSVFSDFLARIVLCVSPHLLQELSAIVCHVLSINSTICTGRGPTHRIYTTHTHTHAPTYCTLYTVSYITSTTVLNTSYIYSYTVILV